MAPGLFLRCVWKLVVNGANVSGAGRRLRRRQYWRGRASCGLWCDALARLRRAGNPESGNTNYTYDNAGNLLTKLDARGITTTMGYDDLNRLLSKSFIATRRLRYSIKWDLVFLGRLGSVGNANSISKVLGYDAMGRPTASEQSISLTEAYRFAYTYNKAWASRRRRIRASEW